jgi:4'-phosphopantetheinyl transferase EntD
MSETIHKIYLSDQISSVAVEEKKAFGAYLDVQLFPEEREQFNTLSNDFRKIEFLGVRRLRNETTSPSPIHYTESRKPFLKKELNTYISISHSKHYCALGVSSKELGIDIEEISPRIERIASRFMNNDEERFIGEQKTLELTKLWTMKEAMFKLNNRAGIEFKTELIIEEKSGDVFTGKMLTENGWNQVKLECFQLDELMISACSYS